MAEDQTYATRVSTLGRRHGSRSRRYFPHPVLSRWNSDGIAAGFSMTYKLLVDPTVPASPPAPHPGIVEVILIVASSFSS